LPREVPVRCDPNAVAARFEISEQPEVAVGVATGSSKCLILPRHARAASGLTLALQLHPSTGDRFTEVVDDATKGDLGQLANLKIPNIHHAFGRQGRQRRGETRNRHAILVAHLLSPRRLMRYAKMVGPSDVSILHELHDFPS